MRGFSWSIVLATFGVACSRPSCCSQAPQTSAPEAALPSKKNEPSADATKLEVREAEVLKFVKARRGGKNVEYVPPSDTELGVFTAWMRELSALAQTGRQPTSAAPAGFELELLQNGLWSVVESKERRRGAGLFIVRPRAASEIVVEAPHTYFDLATLEIALSCFDVMNARALLLNTVRRTSSEGTELDDDERHAVARSGHAESDLAHAEKSFFTATHDVFARTEQVIVIQLHGFRDERAPDVGVVLSASGTELPLEPIANALAAVSTPQLVKRYPSEIKILGGMTNVQARHSRALGRGFLHLEIARTLRERMRENVGLRRLFAENLQRGLVEARTRAGMR